MSAALLRVVRAVLRLSRDAVLVMAIAVALLLVLELLYRAIAPPARTMAMQLDAAVDSSMHPYAREPWWPEYRRSSRAARRPRFDPYRTYWPKAVRTKYANTDSAGHRLTIQPAFSPHARRVWMLGGSTMWGFTARDSSTIPSLVAGELAARGVTDVEVVNLGQSGYNSTQELITMTLELARGEAPTVAVFVNGFNDVATALRFGSPGQTYWDAEVADRIALGSRGFMAELFGLGRHSRLIGRLRSAVGVGPSPVQRNEPPPDHVCGNVGRYYSRIADIAESVARGHGFPTLYLLQPVQSASHKPLSDWERYLARKAQDAAEPWRLAVGRCMTSIDSAMTSRGGRHFSSLAGLFDADGETVFVDDAAHLTEAANRRVAERIVDLILPYLTSGNTTALPRAAPAHPR